MKLTFRQWFLFLFAACCAATPASVRAQVDSILYQLEPVTVTATRLSERWLEVPLALSVLERPALRQTRGYGLDDVVSSVPGVLAQSRYGNQDVRLTIRGFGARGSGARSNAGTSRGVRVLIDGFPETEPDGRTSFDLVDLSGAGRVEIVRSNASSVYGNATGGVLNVMSNTTFERPYASVGAMFGDFGFQKQLVQAGAGLGSGKMFLSLSNTKADGWRVHSASSQTLVNTGIVADLSGSTDLGVYLSGTTNLFRIPGPLTPSQFDSLAQQADSVFIKRDERRINRLGRLGMTLTHGLDPNNTLAASVFVAPKVLQRSERNRYRDFNRYHVGGNIIYRNTAGLGAENHNTFLTGVDEAFQDGAILFYNLTPNGDRDTALPVAPFMNKREGANNFGVFLHDEVSLGEAVSVSAGARYDNITYYYDDYITPTLNDRKSFQKVTPKLGLTYRISPTHSVYANLGGGVEVPAGNEVDPSPTFGDDVVHLLNPLLEPITSTTVEVGMKNIVSVGPDGSTGTLMSDIALYGLEVRNDIVPYSGGAFYFTAGKSRRLGAEIGEMFQFRNGVALNAALTLSDNKYLEYTIDSVHYGKAGAFADLKDKNQAGVPDMFFNVGVRVAPPSLSGAYARAAFHGVGSYFADDRNLYQVPSYSILDLAAGFDRVRLGEGGMVLSGFVGVNNVAGKKYAGSAWVNPDLHPVTKEPVYLEPGLPRNVVGSLTLGWDF